MAHLHTRPAAPMHLGQVAFPVLAFAVLFAGAVFGSLKQPNAAFFRLYVTDWMAGLLALPAAYLMVRNSGLRLLGHWWRLSWTMGLVMFLVHGSFAFGLVGLFDPAHVASKYGLGLGIAFYGLIAVWLLDLLAAWNRYDWADAEGRYRTWQRVACGAVSAGFIVMLLALGGDPAGRLVGALWVVVLGLAFLLRAYEREATE